MSESQSLFAAGVGVGGMGIMAVELAERELRVLCSFVDGINEARFILPLPPVESRVVAIGTAGPALVFENGELWVWQHRGAASLERGQWHNGGVIGGKPGRASMSEISQRQPPREIKPRRPMRRGEPTAA